MTSQNKKALEDMPTNKGITSYGLHEWAVEYEDTIRAALQPAPIDIESAEQIAIQWMLNNANHMDLEEAAKGIIKCLASRGLITQKVAEIEPVPHNITHTLNNLHKAMDAGDLRSEFAFVQISHAIKNHNRKYHELTQRGEVK